MFMTVRTSPCLLLLVALSSAPPLSAQRLVDSARRYLEAQPGHFEYLADLDLDGDDDAVWFQDDPGPDDDVIGFRVYWNDGSGDLVDPGPMTLFPSVGTHRSVSLGGTLRLEDVTGDGLPDMLAQSTSLHVYPATAPGVFGAPISIPMSGSIRCVGLGNVDADATREIAVVELVGAFPAMEVTSWHDWNGTTFVRSAESSISSSSGAAAVRLAVLDIEGDGDSDLAYGRTTGSGLRVLVTSDGAPGPVTILSLPIEPAWISPLTCDLEGGGSEDLLVVVLSSSVEFELVPVLNEGGVLVPQAAQGFTADWHTVNASGFRPGDWDGDGDADVAYFGWQLPAGTTEGIVAFFENDGANGFGSAPVAFAETHDPPPGSSWTGSPLEMTDLDGDGRLDLVLPRSVQFGRGRFEPTLVEITDTFFGAWPSFVFDLEGDGDLDLLLLGGQFAGESIALNDGTGAFEELVPQPSPPPGRQWGGVGALGDFTGDGRPDLLGAIYFPPPTQFDPPTFDETRLYANDGLGGFTDAGRASSDRIGSKLAADLDRDGDLDVIGLHVTGGGYWPNRGQGRFAGFEPLFGSGATPVALGDLDDDGSLDVVTASFPATVTAWRNRDPGRVRRVGMHVPAFDALPVLASPTGSVDAYSVNLADHDQDGDLDLALAFGQVEIRLFVNDGTGVYSPGAILSTNLPPAGAEPRIRFMAFEDLDDDGNVDLLGGPEDSDYPRVVLAFRGLGGGSFEAARPYSGGGIMGPPADVDGDGDLDLSGVSIVRSLRFDGPEHGRVRQYGAGTAGTGEAAPVIGARGPLRVGVEDATLRLRGARGGAQFALFYSLSAGTGPAVPYPGSPTLLGEPIFQDVYVADGAPGVAGAGTFDLDLGPMLIDLAGVTVYFQAGVVDPEAADGFALSNGLELTFGL